jgi:hypothetical protein
VRVISCDTDALLNNVKRYGDERQAQEGAALERLLIGRGSSCSISFTSPLSVECKLWDSNREALSWKQVTS